MLIRRNRGWELRDSAATPEPVFLQRRTMLKAIGLGSMLMPGLTVALAARAADDAAADPSAALYPFKRNPRYTLDRPVTDPKYSENYNNFYEFGSEKSIADDAQALKIRPWTVKIDGMVEKPIEIGIDDLLKKMPIEERLYRHRCVEAWSMAVPWSGFAMAALVAFARPLGSAKYVHMETFLDTAEAPGQKQFWYPWPYVEGVTVAEANNELAFMVTGMYGKPVPKQDGAPLRLVLPWKYGFKSIKSIVRISFTDKQPVTFWQSVGPDEYGFWANVNPEVPHPRWSQATERVLGTDERVPTLKWNGYGAFVAHLYDGLQDQKLFM
ncbi:MAG TPA: protein-methionine-sulfoxide reductase catalytic subunit MsrP [Stellaceae bacterium]|jgi:sulfoxide reductase catalytic subunit YedY|nr:protein-methionine-sulfoxide reductase catalytic subunit MsrP [Stellaceae bacterium]